jgi:hypothetical protein
MCTKTSDGAWPAMRDGGSHDGVAVFPARGWRTRVNKVRRVSRECGDAFPVPNSVGDGAEGGRRWWGGSGSYRR